MTAGILTKQEMIPSVGMSEIIFLTKLEQASCVVGSCIALTLYHPRSGIGALAHIVLPKSLDRNGKPGKFVDTAVPHMLDTLAKKGADTAGLVAKIFGGASMFGPRRPIQIGDENMQAVTELLKQLSIRIAGEHLGGSKGRRITFDCQTGQVTVEIFGEPVETM